MSGFMTSTTALKIFAAQVVAPDADNVRQHVFTPTPRPDGKRIGWVGLGDPLDLDFSFGIDHGQFMAFSLRIDERKPSGAAIKIRLAEALKEEAAANEGRVPRNRKKELKESITAAVTAKADYIPSLADCILDVDAKRLYVATTSESVLTSLLELFQQTFGVMPTQLFPQADMADVFAGLFRESATLDGTEVCANGCTVTLATPEQAEDAAQVAVVNNESAVATALEEGLRITKMALATRKDGEETFFTLSGDLAITGLKLPKGEKGDEDATFLLKADTCAQVASIVEALSK
jgi:DNA recombination-dependent growth factor C